jgi:hypothetical protein
MVKSKEQAVLILAHDLVERLPIVATSQAGLLITPKSGDTSSESIAWQLANRLRLDGFSVETNQNSAHRESLLRIEVTDEPLTARKRSIVLRTIGSSGPDMKLEIPYFDVPWGRDGEGNDTFGTSEPKSSKKAAIKAAYADAIASWKQESGISLSRAPSMNELPVDVYVDREGPRAYRAFVRIRWGDRTEFVSLRSEHKDAFVSVPAPRRRIPSILSLFAFGAATLFAYSFLDFKTHGWHTRALRRVFGMILFVGAWGFLKVLSW